MTNKHTPGPWRLDESIHAECIDDNYHFIGAGRGCTPMGFAISGCMSIHDARVIAAAPDLLEQAEKALAWFLKLQDWSGVGDPDIDGLRAAINKAKHTSN